jgi:hypothetical protein
MYACRLGTALKSINQSANKVDKETRDRKIRAIMQALNDEGVFDTKSYAAVVTKSLLSRENSDSSRSSHKRKSFEDNDENSNDQVNIIAPVVVEEILTIPTKKVRVNDTAPTTKSSKLRFTSTTASSAATTSIRGKTQSGTTYAPSVPTSATLGTSPRGKSAKQVTTPARPVLAVVASPLPVSSTTSSLTPRRPQTNERSMASISETPRISGNLFLKKIQKDLVDEVTGTTLVAMVDRTLTGVDEKLLAIHSSLKAKPTQKWDVKEKNKRYDTAVKEFKEVAALTQNAIKSTREACLAFETKICSGVRDAYDHLVDDAQAIAQYLKSEKQLRKDIEGLHGDVRSESSKFAQFKTETFNTIHTMETEKLLKEKEKERLNEKLCELETQLSKLQQTHQEHLNEVKESQNKVSRY